MTAADRHSNRVVRSRRRAEVRRRRLLEAGTGWLLVVAVGASVAMGAMLWSGALWSATPLVSQDPTLQTPTYVGPEDVGKRTVQDVATPERIVLMYPGHVGDVALGPPTGSNGADFLPVWEDLQAVLAAEQNMIASAGTSGLKPLVQDLGAYANASSDAGGAAVQADFGPVLPWSQWLGAVQGHLVPPTPNDPAFERLVILPDHLGACGMTPAWLYLVAGTLVHRVAVSAAVFAPLCNEITGLRFGTPDGYPLTPLDPTPLSKKASNALADPAGLLVPVQQAPALAWWQPGRLRYESYDSKQAQALAQSLLPDQPWRSRDGSNFITPEGDALEIDAGSGRVLAVFRQIEGQLPGWFQALDATIPFITTKGGWPPTAWLSGAVSGYANCTLATCPAPEDVTFSFSTRYKGLPVLSPYGSAPALFIEMTGKSPHPIQYSRMVPILSDAGGTPDELNPPAPPKVGAAQAINVALEYPPPELTGGSGQTLQVTNVMPTYVPEPYALALEPAWAVELDQPETGALDVVLVDAMKPAVLGVWRPT